MAIKQQGATIETVFGTQKGIELLQSIMQEENGADKRACIRALGQFRGTAAMKVLVDGLWNSEYDEVPLYLEALGVRDPQLPVLQASGMWMKHPDDRPQIARAVFVARDKSLGSSRHALDEYLGKLSERCRANTQASEKAYDWKAAALGWDCVAALVQGDRVARQRGAWCHKIADYSIEITDTKVSCGERRLIVSGRARNTTPYPVRDVTVQVDVTIFTRDEMKKMMYVKATAAEFLRPGAEESFRASFDTGLPLADVADTDYPRWNSPRFTLLASPPGRQAGARRYPASQTSPKPAAPGGVMQTAPAFTEH
ncbi:MAG: HEAT repeat domain-containing protein [Armatimonadota bacterium]|nr:HEAT repeat domain-containing protein [Armatimonadota bacterium]